MTRCRSGSASRQGLPIVPFPASLSVTRKTVLALLSQSHATQGANLGGFRDQTAQRTETTQVKVEAGRSVRPWVAVLMEPLAEASGALPPSAVRTDAFAAVTLARRGPGTRHHKRFTHHVFGHIAYRCSPRYRCLLSVNGIL